MTNVTALNTENLMVRVRQTAAQLAATYLETTSNSTNRESVKEDILASRGQRVANTAGQIVISALVNRYIEQAPQVTGVGKVNYFINLNKSGATEENARNCDFDVACWTIALSNLGKSGFVTYKALNSAITNWIDEDGVETVIGGDVVRDAVAGIIQSLIDLKLVGEKTTKLYTLVEGLKDEFNGYVLAEDVIEFLCLELVVEVDKARPIMAPMFVAAFDYDAEGNSEIGMTLYADGSKPTATCIESAQRLGSVGFQINEEYREELRQQIPDTRFAEEEKKVMGYLEECEGTRYFQITKDWRGRSYYRGGLTTPQGDDACKGAYQFADGVELGEDGLFGILMHMSSVCGLD